MAKITWVSADYDDTLPVFGAALIVHFDNSQTLFFSLESKANDPEFAALCKDGRLFKAQTDGESIYWPDGPRLTIEEIMEMLQADADDKNIQEHTEGQQWKEDGFSAIQAEQKNRPPVFVPLAFGNHGDI